MNPVDDIFQFNAFLWFKYMREIKIYGDGKMVGGNMFLEEVVDGRVIFDSNVEFFIMRLLGHEILTDFDEFQEEYQEDDEL